MEPLHCGPLRPNKSAPLTPFAHLAMKVRPGELLPIHPGNGSQRVHFFSSRAAAGPWLEAYPEGMLNTVDEDFDIHRRVLEQLGWKRG